MLVMVINLLNMHQLCSEWSTCNGRHNKCRNNSQSTLVWSL